MDWYGEKDKSALNTYIDEDFVLYNVKPLNNEKQLELAEVLKLEAADKFVEKFKEHGFLSNPQIFVMIKDIYEQNKQQSIINKIDLYNKFVEFSLETNEEHSLNITTPSKDEIFKYAGYIAFYYMFCDIDNISDSFIDNIANEENYPKDKIKAVLKNTKLFNNEGFFIHRTIAEFLSAKFIFDCKYQSGTGKERIKGLFKLDGRIPTELRGCFSWLCALSSDFELIKIDPYYQIIHGDNSIFNIDLKKKIILEVKNHANNKSPWFLGYEEYQVRGNLLGFYSYEMDDFFIGEFKNSLEYQNHYLRFITYILEANANILSKGMKDFLKSEALGSCLNKDNLIDIRNHIIKVFKDNTDVLEQILQKVKNNEILDNDHGVIKNTLLKVLYPNFIDNKEILSYLKLYSQETYYYISYDFLYETKYKNQYELVDGIHKMFKIDDTYYLNLPSSIKRFVKYYFIETILKFDNGLSAKEIYEILKHFKSYYTQYVNTIFDHYSNKEKLEANKDKIKRLSDELFSLYIDDEIKDGESIEDYHFKLIFPYAGYKNKKSEIVLSKMKTSLKKEQQISLLSIAFYQAKKDESNNLINIDEIKIKAKEFGLEEKLNNWLNPEKQQWEINNEKNNIEQQKKDEKIKQENEDYFAKKTDIEIGQTFDDLRYAADLVIDKNNNQELSFLTLKTFNRLKSILKNAIFNELTSPELLNLDSLANNSPYTNRRIDMVYCKSLNLNEPKEVKIDNPVFLDYLYIIMLQLKNIITMPNDNYVDYIDNKKQSTKILKKYTILLINIHLPQQKNILLKYINKIENIKSIKRILTYQYPNSDIKNNLLGNFLQEFSFKITQKDLNTLAIDCNLTNKNKIKALKVLFLDFKKDINIAISLKEFISPHYYEENLIKFEELNSSQKVKVINYMISAFNTKESIKHSDGAQSNKQLCASFLDGNALYLLNVEELEKLKESHNDKDDIWRNKIYYAIAKRTQEEVDNSYSQSDINKIKQFILQDSIISKQDFYNDVCIKLNSLKEIIEDNRDNDKNIFYENDKSKKETECRDIIVQRLKDKYGEDWHINIEKKEANNQVDINIKHRKLDYEVQIECKRDDNTRLYKDIEHQLIDKYLSSKVRYGIYLIFYFGDKKDKDLMLKKLEESIPYLYLEKIKIIYINLT